MVFQVSGIACAAVFEQPQFVIAYECVSIGQAAVVFEHTGRVRPTIDQVSEKDDPVCGLECHLLNEFFQLVETAVDISYDNRSCIHVVAFVSQFT